MPLGLMQEKKLKNMGWRSKEKLAKEEDMATELERKLLRRPERRRSQKRK